MACTKALCILIGEWLASHGYSQAQQYAVLNYIHRESDFNPDTIERTGACLYQWAGERRRAILKIGHGHCPDWRTQVEFADYELRHTFCGFFHTSNPYQHIRVHFGSGAIERCR